MEVTLQVHTQNMQHLEQLYEGLKAVANHELTKDFLNSKLKVTEVLWNKVYDTHTTIMESMNSDLQMQHEYFATNKFDSAFSTYDATITLIFTFLDMLNTQVFIRSMQIEEAVKVVEHQNQIFHSTLQQNSSNLTNSNGNDRQMRIDMESVETNYRFVGSDSYTRSDFDDLKGTFIQRSLESVINLQTIQNSLDRNTSADVLVSLRSLGSGKPSTIQNSNRNLPISYPHTVSTNRNHFSPSYFDFLNPYRDEFTVAPVNNSTELDAFVWKNGKTLKRLMESLIDYSIKIWPTRLQRSYETIKLKLCILSPTWWPMKRNLLLELSNTWGRTDQEPNLNKKKIY